MSNNDIEQIKNKLDIVDVVREHLPQLKPSGTNWKGLCPFHNEKTPSFMVSSDKQIFHCFGCEEGGDLFTFVMKINGYDFPEALSLLADKAGVTLTKNDPKRISVRTTLFDIHEFSAALYHKRLLSEDGRLPRQYLSKRNVSKETMQELRIGVSPDSWDRLSSALAKKGYSGRDALASGLVIQSDKGKMYDRFRNRIMLPLVDIQGTIVGFSGRTFEVSTDEQVAAKYINSPQTEIYNKSELLYGLFYAKKAIREKDEVVIVEGNFDWLQLYQAGFTNTVALSGTALSTAHIRTLKRFTSNIVFALDTDDAGLRAFERSVSLALENEMNVYVIDYQETGAKDPDEVVMGSREKWKQLISEKKIALAYLIEHYTQAVSPDDIIAKKKALLHLSPFLSATRSRVEREHFSKKLSERLRITETVITEAIQKHQKENTKNHATEERLPETKKDVIDERMDSIGWQTIAFILTFPKLSKSFKTADLKCITDADLLEIFSYIQKNIVAGNTVEYSHIRDRFKAGNKLDAHMFTTEKMYGDFSESDIVREYDQLWELMQSEFYQKQLERISSRIQEAEQGGDYNTVDELIRKQQSLIEERSKNNNQ